MPQPESDDKRRPHLTHASYEDSGQSCSLIHYHHLFKALRFSENRYGAFHEYQARFWGNLLR